MTKTVAVGDIHGDYRKLLDVMEKLLAKVDPYEATFVFLGDYVDGALHTRQVIDELMGLNLLFPHWHFLMGNHEHMLLDAVLHGSKTYGNVNQWWTQGGLETFLSYVPDYDKNSYFRRDVRDLRKGIDDEHLEWLAHLSMRAESESFHFVHAGFRPKVKIANQAKMDMLWIRNDFIESNYVWDKPVVFGHTYFTEVFDQNQRLGIDTMHHGRGVLTAVILDEETKGYEIVQSFST